MDGSVVSPSSEVRTLVLVGKTGNGKSATGNSILRRQAFKSMTSPAGVTSTCQLQSTVLEDGQSLNVVDTPGLFDFSTEIELIGKEIVKCIDMAKDGIHAVFLVLSVRSRFSREEENAVQSLRKFFGSQITDYMIVVFTGGDDLEENDETLDDYLARDCPEPLKEILKLCGNRCVLFDNKTKEEAKKSKQLKQLLSLVNRVVDKNGGKPFTNELFAELKKQNAEVNSLEEYSKQLHKSREELLKRITELFETKLKETTHRFEQQLTEEQTARHEAETMAEAAQKQSIRLEQQLAEEQTARREAETMAEAAQKQSIRLERQLTEEQIARHEAETMAETAQKQSIRLERQLAEEQTARREAETMAEATQKQSIRLEQQLAEEQTARHEAETMAEEAQKQSIRLERQLAEEKTTRREAEAMAEATQKQSIRLEQQLAEEQTTRRKEKTMAEATQKQSNDEIRKLKEDLEKAQKETVVLRILMASRGCAMM